MNSVARAIIMLEQYEHRLHSIDVLSRCAALLPRTCPEWWHWTIWLAVAIAGWRNGIVIGTPDVASPGGVR